MEGPPPDHRIGELLGRSGGLVVVIVGVIAVMTITSASMGTVPDEERATARAVSEAKVERLAAHVDAEQAVRVLDAVDRGAADGQPHA